MGVDISIYLAKQDKDTGLYNEIALYKRGEEYHYNEEGERIIDNPDFCKVPVFWGRDSEMFEALQGKDEYDYGIFPSFTVNENLCDEDLRSEIEKMMGTVGTYSFREINLSDMKIYTLEHPKVLDYDAAWEDEGEPVYKPNPITALFEDICNYIAFVEGWEWTFEPLSHYKMIFFFSH